MTFVDQNNLFSGKTVGASYPTAPRTVKDETDASHMSRRITDVSRNMLCGISNIKLLLGEVRLTHFLKVPVM